MNGPRLCTLRAFLLPPGFRYASSFRIDTRLPRFSRTASRLAFPPETVSVEHLAEALLISEA